MIDGSENVIVIIGNMFHEIVCTNGLLHDVITHDFQVDIY